MKRLIKVLLTVLFGRPRTPPWPWENPPGRRLAATSGRKHLRGFGWTDLGFRLTRLARGFLSS
jgi:hypothetical protein